MRALELEEKAASIVTSLPSSVQDLRATIVELTTCVSSKEDDILRLKKRLEVDGDVLEQKKSLEKDSEKLKEQNRVLTKKVEDLTKHKEVSLETEEILRESIAELERELQLDEDPEGGLRLDENTRLDISGQEGMAENAKDCLTAVFSFLPDSLDFVKERILAYFIAGRIREMVKLLSRTSTQAVTCAMKDCEDTMAQTESYIKNLQDPGQLSLLPSLNELFDLICSFGTVSPSLACSVDMKLAMLDEALSTIRRKSLIIELTTGAAKTLQDALGSLAAEYRESMSSSTTVVKTLERKVTMSDVMITELSSQVSSQKRAIEDRESRAALQQERLKAALEQADAASDLRVLIRAKQNEIDELKEEMEALQKPRKTGGDGVTIFRNAFDAREALKVCSRKQWNLQQKIMAHKLKDLQSSGESDLSARLHAIKNVIFQQFNLKQAMANARVVDLTGDQTSGIACLREAHKTVGFTKTLQKRRSQKQAVGSVRIKVTHGYVSAQQLEKVGEALNS